MFFKQNNMKIQKTTALQSWLTNPNTFKPFSKVFPVYISKWSERNHLGGSQLAASFLQISVPGKLIWPQAGLSGCLPFKFDFEWFSILHLMGQGVSHKLGCHWYANKLYSRHCCRSYSVMDWTESIYILIPSSSDFILPCSLCPTHGLCPLLEHKIHHTFSQKCHLGQRKD